MYSFFLISVYKYEKHWNIETNSIFFYFSSPSSLYSLKLPSHLDSLGFLRISHMRTPGGVRGDPSCKFRNFSYFANTNSCVVRSFSFLSCLSFSFLFSCFSSRLHARVVGIIFPRLVVWTFCLESSF